MTENVMPKKNMTEEERKAFGEKMKAAREAKKNAHKENPPTEETQTSETQGSSPKQVTLDEDKFNQLMERLAKLEEAKTQTTTEAPKDSGFDHLGRPVGVIQRYSVDPANYKDPRDQLKALPELQRFAFAENFMLEWDIDQLIYETKFGTSFADPKFTLVLWKKMFDEDGKPNGKRILIQTGIFFEDPAASIKEAAAMGLPIDKANSPEFLEQMRFYRYKQWLLDIFNPKRPTNTSKNYTEMVVDNKIVRVEDYSTLA